MKILFDTHYLIWALDGERYLSNEVKEIILSPENEIFYSIISQWEIAIKILAKPDTFTVNLENIIEKSKTAGYKLLNLKPEHILNLSTIKLINSETKHKDPFDKMLIAQAKSENMLLITKDQKLSYYSEACVKLI